MRKTMNLYKVYEDVDFAEPGKNSSSIGKKTNRILKPFFRKNTTSRSVIEDEDISEVKESKPVISGSVIEDEDISEVKESKPVTSGSVIEDEDILGVKENKFVSFWKSIKQKREMKKVNNKHGKFKKLRGLITARKNGKENSNKNNSAFDMFLIGFSSVVGVAAAVVAIASVVSISTVGLPAGLIATGMSFLSGLTGCNAVHLISDFVKKQSSKDEIECINLDNLIDIEVTNDKKETKNKENSLISKFKLTRTTKKVQVKDCNLKYVKGLGIYYLSVPIENKNTQRYIRNEIKSAESEEKIRQFETEDKKVYVLNRETVKRFR